MNRSIETTTPRITDLFFLLNEGKNFFSCSLVYSRLFFSMLSKAIFIYMRGDNYNMAAYDIELWFMNLYFFTSSCFSLQKKGIEKNFKRQKRKHWRTQYFWKFNFFHFIHLLIITLIKKILALIFKHKSF